MFPDRAATSRATRLASSTQLGLALTLHTTWASEGFPSKLSPLTSTLTDWLAAALVTTDHGSDLSARVKYLDGAVKVQVGRRRGQSIYHEVDSLCRYSVVGELRIVWLQSPRDGGHLHAQGRGCLFGVGAAAESHNSAEHRHRR